MTMKNTATAAEARQYLRDDNGWTDAEVDELFAEVGTHARTHAQWYEDVDKYTRDHAGDQGWTRD